MNALNKFKQISLRAKLVVILGIMFVISVVIQCVFFPTTTPFGPVAVGKMQTWESQLGKFSIDYPDNWIARELPQGNHGDMEVIAVVLPRNNYLPQVYISQKDFSPPQISDIASWGDMRNQSRGDYNSLKLENISTPNITGQVREYVFTMDSLLGATKWHCLDLYTLNNKLGYQFSFCVDEKDWTKMNPVFQQMIQSVAFN